MSNVTGTLTWTLDTLEDYLGVLESIENTPNATVDTTNEENKTLTVTIDLEI